MTHSSGQEDAVSYQPSVLSRNAAPFDDGSKRAVGATLVVAPGLFAFFAAAGQAQGLPLPEQGVCRQPSEATRVDVLIADG